MISKKTKYALKALFLLAKHYDEKMPLLISEIAAQEGIPKKFLEFILLELKNKGVLRSKKGKGGGYFLARSPDHVTVGSVIEALEGPLSPLACLGGGTHAECEECADESACEIKAVMQDVYSATEKILGGTTLQEAIDRAHQREAVAMYHI